MAGSLLTPGGSLAKRQEDMDEAAPWGEVKWCQGCYSLFHGFQMRMHDSSFLSIIPSLSGDLHKPLHTQPHFQWISLISENMCKIFVKPGLKTICLFVITTLFEKCFPSSSAALTKSINSTQLSQEKHQGIGDLEVSTLVPGVSCF